MEHRRNPQHPEIVPLQQQPKETPVFKIPVNFEIKQKPPKDRPQPPQPPQVPPKDQPTPVPAQVPPKDRPPAPKDPPSKR